MFPRCMSPAGMTCFLRAASTVSVLCAEGAGSAFARENQYLIAGPWMHIPWGDRVGAAEFWARGSARHGRDSAAVVQSLAEGLGRIFRRAAHSPFRAWEKIAGGRPMSGRGRQTYALYLHSDGPSEFAQGRRHAFSRRWPRAMSPATFLFMTLKFPCWRRADPRRPADSLTRPYWRWEIICWSTRPSRSPIPFESLACRACRSIAPHRRRRPISPRSWCASGLTARRNSSASASHVRVGFSREAATRRTTFITGNSIWNQRRAFCCQAIVFGSRLPAAHFRFTTAIPGAMYLRAAPLRGIGSLDSDRLSRQPISRGAVLADRARSAA